jgi:hypothetical protein
MCSIAPLVATGSEVRVYMKFTAFSHGPRLLHLVARASNKALRRRSRPV